MQGHVLPERLATYSPRRLAAVSMVCCIRQKPKQTSRSNAGHGQWAYALVGLSVVGLRVVGLRVLGVAVLQSTSGRAL